MNPGVYFGVPMAEYRAIDAVGSSALRDMLISPLDCWAKHVNPHRREKEDTAATLRGTAFHAMLLEGIDAFNARYYPALNRDAFSDVLWSGDQLSAECARLGVAKGGTLADRAERLVAAGVPVNRIGPLIEADYEEQNAGKIELPHEEWDRIVEAYSVMEQAGIAKAFTGGQPEVTIVYPCELTGLLRKARIDYLKSAAAFDLKTFSNVAGKELATAVAHAFIYQRQHVQAVDYFLAIEQAKRGGFPSNASTNEQASLARALRNDPEHGKRREPLKPHDYFMLYRQAGEVPNVAVRRVARKGSDGTTNAYWRAAEDDRALALKEYRRHLDRFGKERPWIESVPIEDFDDCSFPGHLIGA